MHILIEILVAAAVSSAFATGILFVGYFAYRSRRARERVEARPTDAAAAPDLLAEYRRLNHEIQDSLGRAATTAKSMRDTVERGVR